MERTISWDNPTQYTDGTAIAAADAARIKIHVFKDGAETYVTLPGVTSWPIEVGAPGTSSTWELTCELDGVTSDRSPAFSYTEPFLKPAPPTVRAIS